MPARPPTVDELDLTDLRDANAAQSLSSYVTDTWRRRAYIRYVALSELRSRQMNSVLGNIWYLLNPILLIAIYALVFGLVLDVTRGTENFIAFVTVGTLTFSYVQRTTLAGAKSVVSNMGLIRSVSFPRAILPLSSSATETIAMLPAVAVMLVVAVATGETPAVRWLALVPVIALVTAFNVGAAMIAARATASILDIQQVLPFVFRLLLYASGVLFNAEAYASGPYQLLFELNPIYCFLTLARWSLLGAAVDAIVVISAIAWTLAVLSFGVVWFQRGEGSYGLD